MNNKIEKKVPKSALAFYIKLYCRKRGNKIKDNKVLIEATKSWLTLNKNDKNQFLKKYHQYQNNIKKTYAKYLKNVKPYLQTKINTALKSNTNIVDENITVQNFTIEEVNIPQNQTNQTDMDINVNNISSNQVSSPYDDMQCYADFQSLENTDNPNHMVQVENIQLIEPAPPKFITGEQLFRMIQENEDNNLTWAQLNNAQKRKYQMAVLSIKKKYLKEYKTYLELLPSEKLFYYYKNAI